MKHLSFFNSFILVFFLVLGSSCSKEMPTIAPSDASVSIEKKSETAKGWHGNDEDDWLVDLIVTDHTGSPVSAALGLLTDTNGMQHTSLTNNDGIANVDAAAANFQYISITQGGSVLEIESAVQSGNTIDVQLK